MLLRRLIPADHRAKFLTIFVIMRVTAAIIEYRHFHGEPPPAVVIAVTIASYFAMWVIGHLAGWYHATEPTAPPAPVSYVAPAPAVRASAMQAPVHSTPAAHAAPVPVAPTYVAPPAPTPVHQSAQHDRPSWLPPRPPVLDGRP